MSNLPDNEGKKVRRNLLFCCLLSLFFRSDGQNTSQTNIQRDFLPGEQNRNCARGRIDILRLNFLNSFRRRTKKKNPRSILEQRAFRSISPQISRGHLFAPRCQFSGRPRIDRLIFCGSEPGNRSQSIEMKCRESDDTNWYRSQFTRKQSKHLFLVATYESLFKGPSSPAGRDRGGKKGRNRSRSELGRKRKPI